jgi:hypothetical protein
MRDTKGQSFPIRLVRPWAGGAAMPEPVKVFYSYAHKDESLRDELAKHLSPLQRRGLLYAWRDRRIPHGSEWDLEIKQHLEAAQIILLLISPDFLASDYLDNVTLG